MYLGRLDRAEQSELVVGRRVVVRAHVAVLAEPRVRSPGDRDVAGIVEVTLELEPGIIRYGDRRLVGLELGGLLVERVVDRRSGRLALLACVDHVLGPKAMVVAHHREDASALGNRAPLL